MSVVRLVCCSEVSSANLRARCRGLCLSCVGLLLPLVFILNFLATSASQELLLSVMGRDVTQALQLYLVGTTDLT